MMDKWPGQRDGNGAFRIVAIVSKIKEPACIKV
jgi:hypothetical protein